MTKEVIKKEDKAQINISGFNGSRSLTPSTIEEAYRIAQAFSKSSFIPQCYRGKPDDAFAAINLGMEVGLPPMRSLQSIAVVNGTPCIYGDAQLALARASGRLAYFNEKYEGQEGEDSFCAVCELQREGDEEITVERFSVADAKKAKLWGKGGTWTTHPKRMMRYKARAFALRDKFADVLLGLTHSVEEMQGEKVIDVTPKQTKGLNISDLEEQQQPEQEVVTTQELYKNIRLELQACDSEDCLNKVREKYKISYATLDQEQIDDLKNVALQRKELFDTPDIVGVSDE